MVLEYSHLRLQPSDVLLGFLWDVKTKCDVVGIEPGVWKTVSIFFSLRCSELAKMLLRFYKHDGICHNKPEKIYQHVPEWAQLCEFGKECTGAWIDQSAIVIPKMRWMSWERVQYEYWRQIALRVPSRPWLWICRRWSYFQPLIDFNSYTPPTLQIP